MEDEMGSFEFYRTLFPGDCKRKLVSFCVLVEFRLIDRSKSLRDGPGSGSTSAGSGAVRGSTSAGGGCSGGSAGAGRSSPAVPDAEQLQFAVTLGQCNLAIKQNQYLNVPVAFQDAHGYARRQRVTLQMGGRSWSVSLKHARRRHGDRTALKYGWHQFCVDNGLRAGDICFFKVLREGDDDGDEHVLKVEVRKKDGTYLA